MERRERDKEKERVEEVKRRRAEGETRNPNNKGELLGTVKLTLATTSFSSLLFCFVLFDSVYAVNGPTGPYS